MKFLYHSVLSFLLSATPMLAGQSLSPSTPAREYIYINERLLAVDTPGQALGAPSGLTATPFSTSRISLAWTDNSSTETGFKIERKTGAGGTYAQIATVAANIVAYSSTGLASSTAYYYRVRAYGSAGNSNYSNEASAVTLGVPAAPAGLTATRISGSQIDLSWSDTSINETGFKIDRKLGAGGTYAQIAAVGANATSFPNTGLPDGTVYYYRVRAYNASGNSGYSNESNACTGTLSGNGTYDGQSANIVYTGSTWDDDPSFYGNAYNSTLHFSRVSQDKATFSFSGDNITWVFAKAGHLGIANIRIDGVNRGNLDTYAPASLPTLWQTAKTWSGLGAGNHTIEITVTGTKNASSSDQYVIVDALIAGISAVGSGPYDDQNAQLKFIGNWTRNETWPLAFTATDSYSNATGSAFTFAFTGTTVTYVYTRAFNRGMAAVTIDGVDKGLVDLYSATDKWQQTATFSSLGSGIHNLQISVSGQKQAAASDYFVDVDRLHVSTPVPPSAPSDLAATAISSTRIDLAWTDNSTNETGFRIERKTGAGGTYAAFATVGTNITAYSNTGLAAGNTYYYRVQAYNSTANSGYTNEASASTSGILAAPSGLTATTISNSQINLTWIDNSSTETGFRIERKLGAGGTYSEIATVAANVTSYPNAGLADATVYYYRVRAYDGSGNSGYTAEANACTGVISGTVDGKSPNIVYSGTGWFNDATSYPLAYAQTQNYSATTGDSATFSFSGTTVRWVHLRFPHMGIASVAIDGIDKGNVDLYSASESWQQINTYSSLGSGNHTITITVTGTKNAASTGFYVDVDAFLVP